MSVFLFAGDNDVCSSGMDAYVGQFDTLSEAMAKAETDAFDWAQIVSPIGVELQLINAGKYSERKRRMLWIKDEREAFVRHTEAEFRQVLGILLVTLQAGIVLIDDLEIPTQKPTRLLAEMVIMSEQIQANVMQANGHHLEAMATCTKDVINRAYQLINPLHDTTKEALRQQWVGSVRSMMKEMEWIRPVPKGANNGQA